MTRAVQAIERAVAVVADEATRPLVLAVSGGLDSMVLLDAAARVARDRIAVVASFDHRSGRHAARAARLVCDEAAARALPAVVGRGEELLHGEAAWREARWDFLHGVAERVGGVVVTAHTEDDQIETVLMRAMRGAGARGLAALYAPSDRVRRPLLRLRRATLQRYARDRNVRFFDDPTNSSRRYFRNRLRHDLLPALLRVRPRLDAELIALAQRAAALRAEIDSIADALVSELADEHDVPLSLHVAASDLAGYDAASLGLLWPAVAGRLGIALDWRGTRRLAAFTIARGRVGASVQLSGGWEVVRRRDHFVLQRRQTEVPAAADLPLNGAMRWGRWSFVREGRGAPGGPWRAVLPGDRPLVVRAWQPGDRMSGPRATPRRVKRFLGDAGIVGPDRAGWPVVLSGEEIVWIPGVGQRSAVAGQSETPGLIYSCELNHR
jgi:tRNA(Ile)-lysidine synthetase-like protein